jgi:type I site-specific restriction-modification system R (restriction) subunit
LIARAAHACIVRCYAKKSRSVRILYVERVGKIRAWRRTISVFWHTQGSGKSLSMVMFAEKVLRRLEV